MISITLSFYVFFRKNNKYDIYYCILVSIVLILWKFTGDECIVSYWERLCIDPDYVFNSKPTVPHVKLVFGDLSDIVLLILLILSIYNLFIMLKLYKVPLILNIIIILYFMVYPIIKARITFMEKGNNLK